MLMTRLPNEPEEEEPKTTDPRRRLELGNAEPGEPKTDVPPKPKKRRSARSLQQNQGSPERKAQDGERRWNPFRTKQAACLVVLELLLKCFWFELLLLLKCQARGPRAFGGRSL